MDEQGHDDLAEAIGRVAVAASMADLAVRTAVGQLGGPGVSILAAEKDSTSTLIQWCGKFVDQLHVPADDVAAEFRTRALGLVELLRKRNTVVHGLWFAQAGDGQGVARRKRGTVSGYVHETYSVAEINQLAQDLRNASFDLTEISQRIVHPDMPPLHPRDGRDVH